MLNYEKPGAEKPVPIYQRPERETEEEFAKRLAVYTRASDKTLLVEPERETEEEFAERLADYETKKDITILVVKLKRTAVQAWAFADQAARLANRKASKGTATEEVGATYDGTEAVVQVQRDYLAKCLTGVSGFSYGGEDVSSLREPAAMIEALEESGHLGAAAVAAKDRQSPTPAQKN